MSSVGTYLRSRLGRCAFVTATLILSVPAGSRGQEVQTVEATVKFPNDMGRT